MNATLAHPIDCLCVPCMMSDLDATIVANGGEEALARISGAMIGVGTDTRSERTRFATPGQRSGRGYVRKLSDRQAKFLSMLLATRDTAGIRSAKWFTTDIENISLAGAKTMIDALLACPMSATTPVRMATVKQAEWLGKLSGKSVPDSVEAIRVKGAGATFSEASAALDILFKAPRAMVATTSPTAVKVALTDGMYLLGERIIKVQLAKQGSGNLYAKELIDGTFSYAPGLINRMGAAVKMTLAEAKAYGRLYGVCCVCSRDLTDESSIAAGIGPVCAGKF